MIHDQKPVQDAFLTLDECREILGDLAISDEQLERLRDSLYGVADHVLNNLYGLGGK